MAKKGAQVNKDWQKLQDFQLDNKHLLIMIADPRTDEISITFGGQSAFVRYPFTDMSKGVVFNALRKSKWESAIDPFIRGIIDATGIDVTNKSGNELLKLLGGAAKSLGVGDKQSKLEVIPKGHRNGNKKSKA